MNTASATSRITFIDGKNGILRYRGYPIEELAEKSTFLEVAYLLIKGELPSAVSQKIHNFPTSCSRTHSLPNTIDTICGMAKEYNGAHLHPPKSDGSDEDFPI